MVRRQKRGVRLTIDGRWEARLRVGGGRRRSFFGKTEREALQKLRKFKEALDEGRATSFSELPSAVPQREEVLCICCGRGLGRTSGGAGYCNNCRNYEDGREFSFQEFEEKDKTCARCGEVKDSSRFEHCDSQPDFLASVCRTCQKLYDRRERTRRRRQRLRKAQREPIDRLAIFKRDGWRCGICGKRVRSEEAVLDHTVPLSEGGTHEPANVQLAHRICNARKGDGRWSSF